MPVRRVGEIHGSIFAIQCSFVCSPRTNVSARRKIVSLVLLAGLFVLAQAAPGIFRLLLQQHYVMMQQGIARKADTVLLLSPGEWAAVKEVKPGEVRIQGRLFDVRQIQRMPNGDVELSGHFDRKEETMLARAKAMDRQSHEVKAPIFLVFMFCEAPQEFSFYRPLPDPEPCRAFAQSRVSEGKCRRDGPPPRLA